MSLISSVIKGRYSFTLHRTVFATEFGSSNGMPLEKRLGAVTSEGHRVVTETYEGETSAAAVTGLMERAHALPEAGKVVFMDASVTWIGVVCASSDGMELRRQPAS